MFVIRNLFAFQMHAPQSLDLGKSQSLCQRLFSLINKTCTFSLFGAILLFLNAKLPLVNTEYPSLLSVRIVPPICCPPSRESTWQPCKEYGPNQIKGDM